MSAYLQQCPLMKINEVPEIRIVVPMHDAILVEAPMDFDEEIINEFINVFTQHFNKEVKGKASVDSFFIAS